MRIGFTWVAAEAEAYALLLAEERQEIVTFDAFDIDAKVFRDLMWADESRGTGYFVDPPTKKRKAKV